jgi:hypothetical protein
MLYQTKKDVIGPTPVFVAMLQHFYIKWNVTLLVFVATFEHLILGTLVRCFDLHL